MAFTSMETVISFLPPMSQSFPVEICGIESPGRWAPSSLMERKSTQGIAL